MSSALPYEINRNMDDGKSVSMAEAKDNEIMDAVADAIELIGD